MDVSTTFSPTYKQTLTGFRQTSASQSFTEYTCPVDCYSLVYLTNFSATVGTNGSCTMGISNDTITSLKTEMSSGVTGTTTKVIGSIFIGPGQSLTSYLSQNANSGAVRVDWVIVEFYAFTR